MASYFEEKGLPDPTFKKKSQTTSTNNPDVSHFFRGTNETGQNEDYHENYSNVERYFSLANFFGAIRDRRAGNGADTNQEFLDNLISQLLEEANANAKGPPPASKKFIQSLPLVPRSEIKAGNVLITGRCFVEKLL
ncbi:7395_t:CDS:2 [Acaulospora colombiana]|uniref:7395_t:CDS:1 n=1 Tax=Acaulospora colombiana TaxID=27376 RepID=A0ACA9KNJ7_9GLOM|nr:7395_t:CDS:2 [Acaulospora colombiana]